MLYRKLYQLSQLYHTQCLLGTLWKYSSDSSASCFTMSKRLPNSCVFEMTFRDQLHLSGICQTCHMAEVDDEGARVRGVSCRTLFVVDQNKLIKVNQVNFYSSFYQLNAEFIIQEKGSIMIDGNQTLSTDSTNRSQAQVTGQSNQATTMV